MESCVKGTLWMILTLLTPPLFDCKTFCPKSCECQSVGHILCRDRNGRDLLQLLTVHTYTLLLDKANMNVLSEKSLSNKTLLLRFGVTNSHLHTIHPLAFHAAPQLKSIKLTDNDLSTLPAQVFSPLSVIEEIYLDGNQLEIIGPDMFEGLDRLLILDLSRNKIRDLPPDMFDGLSNLFLLNLGRNNIKKLSPTIFHTLTKLQLLRMYYNELEVLEPGIFDRLKSLNVLSLHHNQIKSLPPRVFWSLENLTDLTLSSNQLKGVPHKSFYNMTKLKKLTIYSNPLLSLPDELMGHMPDMTQFYLYDTNLITVPGNLFANMSGLLELNLHLNDKLRYLPPDLFCCLPNLKKLSLRNNSLQDLPPNLFSTLATMKILLLNDNKLKTLPENIFQDLTSLVTIDLKNNDLNTLPGDIFLSNTALKAVTLSENPWNCDCAIREFVRWIRENDRIVLDKDDVICHSPLFSLLRGLHTLPDDEFSFCDEKTTGSLFLIQTVSHEPTQTPYYTSVTPTTKSTTSETTTYSATVYTSASSQADTIPNGLPVFHDVLMVKQGPDYVHHDTQTPYYTSDTPTTKSTTLETTPYSPMVYTAASSQADVTPIASPVFYDLLVVEEGPEYVHHNIHKHWVYVWFLPSGSALVGSIMFCYILLLVVGLVLILAAIYGMHRLGTAMDKINAECAQNEEHTMLSDLVHA
ncbi:platelet glycoprotein V-like [Xiphophorus maculatus]|uniref:Platelet glycoprotein V-like n=1 Tax=Xiphophorus maculatus TaxID=8083 RepID=A0A3B5Q8D2_XIPMA|nr:platelet glycoprotein V-like [Xiphophorus maculatus]